jgi:hypothetical protein
LRRARATVSLVDDHSHIQELGLWLAGGDVAAEVLFVNLSAM